MSASKIFVKITAYLQLILGLIMFGISLSLYMYGKSLTNNNLDLILIPVIIFGFF